jgi:hypothetical protein
MTGRTDQTRSGGASILTEPLMVDTNHYSAVNGRLVLTSALTIHSPPRFS